MLKLLIFNGFLAKPLKLYKIMGFSTPCWLSLPSYDPCSRVLQPGVVLHGQAVRNRSQMRSYFMSVRKPRCYRGSSFYRHEELA